MNVRSIVCFMGLVPLLCGCDVPGAAPDSDPHAEAASNEVVKGSHGGRLLTDGTFALELAIFETGVPPEFRAWASDDDRPIAPADVSLEVTLTRLGDVKDVFEFAPQDDFLRGSGVVYEPHSFVVGVEARHRGAVHRWQYDSFEGRTRIAADVAAAFGLETDVAGPATIHEKITAYGEVRSNPERVRDVRARFPGVVRSVNVSVGDRVERGQTLAVVESNDSLQSYSIAAPQGGTLVERFANPGEQTDGRSLFTIVDLAEVWVELAVFPSDRAKVRVGAPVALRSSIGDARWEGAVSYVSALAGSNQAVSARVALDNTDGSLIPGAHVTAEIEIGSYEVPLAVRRIGLQSFRDFTVVYARIDDEYEVRMLELGRAGGEWVEVLGGLDAGTRYVTTNSYLVKADIEKSGASHDH